MTNWTLCLVLLSLWVGQVRAEDCPNTAGIVIGTIFGTLAVVALVVLLIWLIRRKKQKQDQNKAATRGKTAERHTYDNPNFVGDDANSSRTDPSLQARREDQASFAEKGFAGYVECREVDSPPKQKAAQRSPAQNNGMGPHRGQGATLGLQQVPGNPLRKAGSHGSLDNSYPQSEPELVSVSLRSHDIIGLGFNICGTVSGGIFVSKVLNRGPASESGCIKVGDRVMSITISFENMVYEDALTILSYASPYPVSLELQKAGSVPSDSDSNSEQQASDMPKEAKPVRLHPLYRSQSMDDVSKINNENEIYTPRRTYSEMKKSTPVIGSDYPDANKKGLKRWEGKESIVREESLRGSDLTPASSFRVPDLSIDSGELLMNLSDNKDEEPTGLQDGSDAEDVSFTVRPLDEGRQSPTHSHSSSVEGHTTIVTNGEVHYHKAELDTDYPNTSTPKGKVSVLSNSENSEDNHNLSNLSTATTASESSAITVIEMSTSRTEQGEKEESVQGEKEEDAQTPSLTITQPVADLRIEDETSPFAARKKRSDRGSVSSHSSSDEEGKSVKQNEDEKSGETQDVGFVVQSVDTPERPTQDSPPTVYVDAALSSPQLETLDTQQATQSADLPVTMIDAMIESSSDEHDEHDGSAPRLPSSPPPPIEASNLEEDRVQDVLKDYFADQPSLLQELGLFGEEDAGNEEDDFMSSEEAEDTVRREQTVTESRDGQQVTVTTTTTTTAHRVDSPVESPDSGLMVNLEEATKRSLSDDSSLSSPNSSPSKDADADADEASTKKGSKSPVISRQSGGGLAFDITTSQFNDLPKEPPPEQRGDPKGGIAYYVSIDDQQAFPAEALLSRSSEGTDQPSLVRTWGLHNEQSYPSSVSREEEATSVREDTTSHVNHEPNARDKDTALIQIPKKMPVKLSDSGFNGMADSEESTPVSSPTDKQGTSITVVQRQDIQGAYTVHVGSQDHSQDDSEA